MKSLEWQLQRNLALNLILVMFLIWITGLLLPHPPLATQLPACQTPVQSLDAPAPEQLPLPMPQRRFNWLFPWLALAGIACTLLLQGLVIRRTLRQLQPIRTEIRQLASGQISRLNENVPPEISPIIHELNYLLTLMQERLERSRHALGNLAHALKGPISLLMQSLDEGGDGPHRQEASLQVERIRQLTERELKRARMAGLGNAAQRFDPQAELPVLASVLARIHNKPAHCIQIDIDPALHSFADREDMLELLGNLLDNACKWATTRVSCRVQRAAHAGVDIRIADDGPGLSEDELLQMTARGTRLDESVAGHGLGLAISKDIIKLYGGSLHFGHSQALGGLQVELHIPLPEH